MLATARIAHPYKLEEALEVKVIFESKVVTIPEKHKQSDMHPVVSTGEDAVIEESVKIF